MSKFMLIGGGNIGRNNTEYETETIDKEIVKMTDKDNPTFLFIGFASSFADSYYKIIKKIYQNLGCNTSYIKKKNLINNPDIVKNKILEADIIYFGGGDTLKLLEKIEENNLKEVIDKAISNNTVIAGMSAGAIMLCREGYSDSKILREESSKHEFIKGLNYLDIIISPHYEEDSTKTKELNNDLKDTNKEVICIPNKCAIKVIDNKYEVISGNKDIKAYTLSSKGKKVFK
ncbi:MAG: Type 1 glutamine amidotransferase-like domain-containing protein [Bacilli bacterium]|nr:Type 1 glutamine amidotransferase-like domain-containing protein [Bacilli bacterium]